MTLINEEAINHSYYDEQQGNHSYGSRSLTCYHINCAILHYRTEGTSNDSRKSRNYQNQGKISKGSKENLSTTAYISGNNLTDGLSLMTERCYQSTEVMDTTEENTTDKNPQSNREPAEECRRNRAGNRTCTCNR